MDKKKSTRNVNKNEKGFTLIELLAVIVILALLIAIAIPSITKYITQSRRKTLVTSINGYVSAIVNEVNDQNYYFSTPNVIFAVPIECIPLEKGGINPFGDWLQANTNYWAYVLVQYDAENFNYRYGFTFKDSSGYGMYPTEVGKISPTSSSQIVTGLNLEKPVSGLYSNIAEKNKWNGFDIQDDTELVVLVSESEGKKGNGKTTCTLCQKGDNYNDVEEEKENAIKDRTLMTTTRNSTTAFWKYKRKILNITFQDNINIPSEINDEYKWDVSSTGNGKLMAYITPTSANSSAYNLYIQGDGKVYASPDSSYLFYDFLILDSINNIEILDTSNVTNMQAMFGRTGRDNKKFTLDLGDNFDTSNVTDMSNMFVLTGYDSTVFTLDLGNKFDTSKVTDMSNMFSRTGYKSLMFKLDLENKFNTSNVINMTGMFDQTGYSSPVFTLDLGDKFDTSNVTNMNGMFRTLGYSSLVFTLDLGDKFDTSNVTNMQRMFASTGRLSPVFTLDLGDNFDTSNAKSMERMFLSTGYTSEVFTLDLGDKFNTSNVINMTGMFENTGYSSPVFTLDLGNKFDTSKVIEMSAMFENSGYSSKIFKVDCSNWNVDKVRFHNDFNTGVISKVTPPTWVN